MTTNPVGCMADAAAVDAPSRLAFVLPDRPCSYAQLADAIRRVTTCLLEADVQPGDRIAVLDRTSIVSVATTLAAARMGAAATLLNPSLRPGEIDSLLSTAGCRRIAVAGDAFADLASALVGNDVLTASQVLRTEPAPLAPPRDNHDDDVVLVLFTSGTSGFPKAVPIRHRVLSARIMGFASPFTPDVRPVMNMLCVPYHHVAGSLGVLGSLYAGNTFVVQERFDAGEWIHLVHQHRAAGVFLVPTMLQRILNHPEFSAAKLGSLVFIAYGAAATPRDLIERTIKDLPHVALANLFGQTETLGAYAAFLPEDHRRRDLIGSVGKPLPGVEVRIVTPDTEDPVASGEVGELLVLSPHNVSPGWLRTGDLARADAEGYLYSAGRLSDTINRHGEKFGPIEVDALLRRHPAVSDVVVTGIPDRETGERVEAFIVLASQSTEDELKAFCRENLARFKVPERITFVDAIPYNETGKVNRPALFALLAGDAAGLA
jgi:acyl-CoA synthetase (AMP-forming)/AMP-acid ligase II